MTRSLATPRLAIAAEHAGAALAAHAPDLLDGFHAALPEAADTVGRRLRGALVREGLLPARPGDRVHAFRRVEYDSAGAGDPADLLPAGLAGNAAGFAAELRNGAVNLAIAMTRRRHVPAGDPDHAVVAGERLAVAGHNLHPCGRTRLGWDTSDVLAHDLEAGHTRLGFVAVRDDVHLGDDVGAVLRAAYPHLPEPPPGYRLQPVHAWQRDAVLAERYRDLIDDGALRILGDEGGVLPAIPTAALRTLLLPVAADGSRRYVKVSLDIQVTSTRRSISVASTRNGPAVSALLRRLVAEDPAADRLLLLAETAGAAVPAGSGRDMSAIVRDGITGRLVPGERAVAGSALPFAGAGLVAEFAATTGRPDDAGAAAAFLDAYARLLLPPLLRLTLRGVALEAHLQNCVPTFVAGVPHRLAVRDFAGLRLHPGRLAAAGHRVALWPGSVVGTPDPAVLRAKIGYTAFQAHLGEVIIRLGESHGLDEDAAWRLVRAVVDETYAGHGPAGAEDHAAFTARTVPHKALVRMRLAGAGDEYVPVENPLHAPA
ncbi:IucA/IucC family protein [Amorphoplanes digitatis]|uniref:Siderophore synthetase component n=1 Tax=Actinoplanes digitatis TaxID=1868 RepID=A0A7W7MR44_9ACTN|nr:IucA/IucC family protein [Actinoplanes digitatis]MBB4763372.1 siderophore synthetase component [Actinoplanes digitatis]GID92192.1 iron transporter [Actinoplanes digitatis]